MYLYLGWRRECSGYVSKPWMTKWMFRVCIYTWDEKENAPGMYLYLRWKSECSGYVSIPGKKSECSGYVSKPWMKERMLLVCIYTWDEGVNDPGMYLYMGRRRDMYQYLGWRIECSVVVSIPWMKERMLRVCIIPKMKERMLWVFIYTWDEEENSPGMYLYLGWRKECSEYVFIPGMKKRMLWVCMIGSR